MLAELLFFSESGNPSQIFIQDQRILIHILALIPPILNQPPINSPPIFLQKKFHPPIVSYPSLHFILTPHFKGTFAIFPQGYFIMTPQFTKI